MEILGAENHFGIIFWLKLFAVAGLLSIKSDNLSTSVSCNPFLSFNLNILHFIKTSFKVDLVLSSLLKLNDYIRVLKCILLLMYCFYSFSLFSSYCYSLVSVYSSYLKCIDSDIEGIDLNDRTDLLSSSFN